MRPYVSEDVYADYMVRYYLHALCSGMIDRVFWWRLVAGHFGLVDDTDPARWRVRPAYEAFRTLLSLLGDATFTGKEDGPNKDVHILRFRLAGGDLAAVAFSSGAAERVELPFTYERALDAVGRARDGSGRAITLAGRPVYLLGVQNAR